MTIDLRAAADFMATHARILDRRRLELRDGQTNTVAVLAALDGYSNSDGGYGWGLEPDLRSPESQPGAAHHAFEVFEEIAPATAPQAAALCDWLQSITLPDGGLPFALPLTRAAGCGPWWLAADPSTSSLQITAVTTAAAHRVAAHDAAVAHHPWLERATNYCLAAIEKLTEPPSAYVLAFSIGFLDAVHRTLPDEADAALKHLSQFIPADGGLPVQGGSANEMLHPLHVAPFPNRPARALFARQVIARDIQRLAALQQPDGGWIVDYLKISPVGALDWRGYATLRALDILRANDAAA